MSPVKQELIDMGGMAKSSGKVLSICHVLRYSPFFVKIKELIDSGAFGQLVSIQHIESVGYWHMAHSFVRGNWRDSNETSPMILAKCCHDMDILLWLTNGHCESLSSFGSLAHFSAENAPKDAPKYCLDGCAHRDDCPYYAPRFYLEHPKSFTDGFAKTVCLDMTREGILNALQTGEYGRCVYHCDNNVVDNQVVNMTFDNRVTVNMEMCAFTDKCERVINVMGSKGQLRGNMEENTLELTDFVTGNKTEIKLHTPSGGHSGSDVSMMKEFCALVAADGALASKSSADLSVESHLIALAAEESRLNNGKPIMMKEYT
ncbi:MAG: gfo/Idh/MocA family oxidoreductase [Ruminococcaceae bacterium]|nr:gfo/Idh/MocA family oxidoreductase [Oscillospiraceae bacterium]